MSTWAYMGGAAGLLIMGQQSGAALLDQALSKDMSTSGIIAEAGNLAGLGVNATDAAIIVAAAGLAYKVLQIAQPFTATLNDKLRQKWGVDQQPRP